MRSVVMNRNREACIPRKRVQTMVTVFILALLVSGGNHSRALAQQTGAPAAQYSQGLQFVCLANMPIAGLLERGTYEIDLRMYPMGGLYTFVTMGFLQSVNVGFSYGADNVIAREKVDWNPNVEFAIKARIIPERINFPAVAIGYASQGYGPFLGALDRYTVKSPGFYAVASKNFKFLGELGLHFGINRSREDEYDNDLNLFGGIDFAPGPDFYLILEYDTGINDDDDNALGYGNGYLNFGIKWAASPRLRLELYFMNLLDNVRGEGKPATIEAIARTLGGAGREIRIVYVDWF